ncbi:MAG TPA: ABC transporter ATP-binding protein [Streptosporangiaceae bacterium]|jgi:peptide/nickel transport system ATP-binding protein|nr:ABC transporter ATP-binding protein [Streptosporangiaceae bacterium]
MSPVLEIKDLSTHIQLTKSVVQAVGNVDLYIDAGETLGLVGESGCGKSMTGLSIMGLLPPGGHIIGGSVKLDGQELVGLPDHDMRRLRGNDVAMIFQDPLTSLDPTKTIGYQVAEPVILHRGASKKEALDRAAEVLGLVGLPRPAERLSDYPHQLSGGLRQRVMIAMALSCEPKLLIADEPTTALDVTIQAQILALLDDLKTRLGMAMLLITHDMGVIAGHSDRVNVMYAGRLVEETDTETLFEHMHHPYTQALLGSIPRLDQDANKRLANIPGIPPDLTHPPVGCRFAARCSRADDKCRTDEPPLTGASLDHRFSCWHPVDGPLALTASANGAGHATVTELADVPLADVEAIPGAPLLEVRDLVKEFAVTSGAVLQRKVGAVHAVSGVSFTIEEGQTFGLVGESGCGKTTIGKVIVALEHPTSGQVLLKGQDVAKMSGEKLRRYRRDLQLMFQDPYSSLDPRMRVGAIVREPLAIQKIGSSKEQQNRVYELLDEVGLPRNAVERYPHEFSGGQRQRIGLARALTLNPRVIVADEPVSALDVSIRAQVLNLMKRLQADHQLTYVVISHDLAVVKYVADKIGVMYLGKLVELGSGDDIYQRAAHPYTAGLIATIPVPDPKIAKAKVGVGIRGELPSPINPPSGCRFRTRCPFAQDRCAEEEPLLRSFGPGHLAACHFPLQDYSPTVGITDVTVSTGAENGGSAASVAQSLGVQTLGQTPGV